MAAAAGCAALLVFAVFVLGALALRAWRCLPPFTCSNAEQPGYTCYSPQRGLLNEVLQEAP